MKELIKKILPKGALSWYHLALAHLAALAYGFPSEKMVVIGVTGTNGKSTTSAFIARVLEEAGHKVGLTTTFNFRIAGKEWLNDSKMTMLGRFRLQKMLAQMVSAGCTYAVIETSSEGIAQHRSAAIHYDIAVFTNLTPEHIESHGSFENYRDAKAKLFSGLMARRKRLNGKTVNKVIVSNIGDAHGDFYLRFRANKKYGYFVPGARDGEKKHEAEWPVAVVKAMNVRTAPDSSTFSVRDVPFSLKMPGLFNIENALAAVSVALSQGIPIETAAAALRKVTGVPGRMEFIDEGQPFKVLVDYAPEPESFRKLYDVVRTMAVSGKIIHVLGSCGGGRDRDRRPVLGRLGAEGANIVIVTNEDPYDDDPAQIIDEVAAGAAAAGKKEGANLFKILDRRAALEKAVSMAAPGDLVIATGKGAEQAIVVAHGKKIPWDDRREFRRILQARK